MSASKREFLTVILGPPGGGKGSISKRLVRDFKFEHISTGDLLRAQVRAGTPLGQEADKHMRVGALVPDTLIVDMLVSEVGDVRDPKRRVLLDGFPRTTGQASVLDTKGLSVDVALSIAVPNEEIVKRLSGRWLHPASGRTYAYDFNPPKVLGKDDETGEDLIQREDDKPEAVRARLEGYDQQAAPLLAFYRERNLLKEFDGNDQPELVAKDRRTDAIYTSLKPFLESVLPSE